MMLLGSYGFYLEADTELTKRLCENWNIVKIEEDTLNREVRR